MNKDKIKLIIVILAIISFIATLIATLILLIYFPPVNGLAYQVFMGLQKQQITPYRTGFGIGFVVFAIIYFFLNKKRKKA